jgi:Tfp pilus assembly protein PilE
MARLSREARRTRAGMTLVEVMIATVLLAFGLLAMLALQMQSLRGSSVGRHYTQAAAIARDLMEELHRLPWDDPKALPTGGWVVEPQEALEVELENVGTVQQQVFDVDYRIQADPTSPADLRLIDVRVQWYEQQDDPAPAPPVRRYAITSVRFDDGK